MQIIHLDDATCLQQSCVATIGMFDGVHRGHQYLLNRIVGEAAKEHLKSMVITFDRHPRQVLHSDYQPQMLNTFDEKLSRLSLMDIDFCVILPFSETMAALSARGFMADVLKRQLSVATLYMGYDNHFGHNRNEGFENYVEYGRELGISVLRSDALTTGDTRYAVSSSVIRKQLQAGDVVSAASCLGYAYTLCGTVVHGEQIGGRIGFPTANLRLLDDSKLIPLPGVYAVQVRIGNGRVLYPAMMNIGTRPTFNGHKVTLEVNIFDFNGNIYGENLTVTFCRRLRDEQRFDSEEALAEQLRADREEIKKMYSIKD